MNNKNIDTPDFNFTEFKAAAIAQIKGGQPLTGKGIFLQNQSYQMQGQVHVQKTSA